METGKAIWSRMAGRRRQGQRLKYMAHCNIEISFAFHAIRFIQLYQLPTAVGHNITKKVSELNGVYLADLVRTQLDQKRRYVKGPIRLPPADNAFGNCAEEVNVSK